MGANCCVAARDKPLPERIGYEVSSYRNVRHSPSWSFRWDNRTHIEDIMDNPSWFSHHNSGNVGSDSKSAADTETEGLSDGGSPSCNLQNPRWRKKVGIAGSSKYAAADQSTRSNLSDEGDVKSSAVPNVSDTKPSVSVSSTPSSSSLKAAYPSSFRSCSLQSNPSSSSRKARRSPGYQLSRQVSDSRIPSLKSLNESSNCSPDSRQSFVLSVCSNDLSAGGSHGGSSDGWSMRTFTELVAASSQRERWSLDSENLSALNSKIVRSSPPSADLQTCRVCAKLLKEISPWSAQKIVSTVSTNDLLVAAVLVCGHVYHADCLESITSETDRYDPPCPECTNGERLTSKLLTKADLKARNKSSRRAVADIDVNRDSSPDRHKWWGRKSLSMGASSSMKGMPFLRRHFSIGSRPPPARSASESESSRKKGLWARYLRD